MTDKTVAFVFSCPTETPAHLLINKFEPSLKDFDVLYLSDVKKDRILKKDITLDFTKLDAFDIVVPVGAESLKHICKLTNVTKYNGLQVEGKYIPLMNPNIVLIKPQNAPLISKALKTIAQAQKGELKIVSNDKDYQYINTKEGFEPILAKLWSVPEFVIDTETSSLNYLTGEILCVIFSTQIHEGYCVSIDVIKLYNEELKKLVKQKKVIFHNAKFDMHFTREQLGWEFDDIEDTMLLHYMLNEAPGTHRLKDLAILFTDLGDYDTALNNFKKEYCRKNKILLADFSFSLIPLDILSEYAMKDGDASMQLYRKFKPLVSGNDKLKNVYETILIPGVKTLTKMERNGGPIDIDYLLDLDRKYTKDVETLMLEIKQYPAVKQFELDNEKDFNPGSVKQLGELLFTYLKLPPVKLTDTGNFSTDVEVLTALDHPFPKKILELRKVKKILGTYVTAILEALDKDGRLRSSFNLQGTTSGRLSSSGNLNYQNLPREVDNKDTSIKNAFKARPGYVIVQADLKTAEVYIAAVLSNDKFLQKAFIDQVDFHSYIAKQIFNLPCSAEEVKNKFPDHRQWAKAITFGIMYQAGARTISETAKVSMQEAQDFINKYFAEAKDLKRFIDKCNSQIENQQFIYSHFGRKRRLMEATASSRGVRNHAIRSGVNFMVQSPSSDINLLASIEAMDWIEANNYQDDILPFALVHDSIVAEVKIELVPVWCQIIKTAVQRDRGLSIPDCPIGVDFEVGPSWAMLKGVDADRVTVVEVKDILENKRYLKK
jgi:DNA polymerase I-like protein with 3'-5' exonuclease and polymerase domains